MAGAMAAPAGVVVVGGALGGLHTVEALRARGYAGPITVVDADPAPHHDRPPLSKDYLAGAKEASAIALRSADRLAALDVTWRLGVAAGGLDLTSRRVALADGTELHYDRLVIATGVGAAWPQALRVPGALTLRRRHDADQLRAQLRPDARLIVIGAGFIGLEVAATFRAAGAEVDVVEAQSTPVQNALGPTVGRALQRRHEVRGVRFHVGRVAVRVRGAAGSYSVTLDDGTTLAGDALLVAVGSRPSVDWLAGAGLDLSDGVVCDAGLQAAPDVWAVGDIASWPHPLAGRRVRVEHWTNAIEQAAFVAREIAAPGSAPAAFAAVPYVWSDQFGARLQAHGFPAADDDVEVTHGDLFGESFTALFRRAGRLIAVVGLNSPRTVLAGRRLLLAELAQHEAQEVLR